MRASSRAGNGRAFAALVASPAIGYCYGMAVNRVGPACPMSTSDAVIARIQAAFGGNDYPGDLWLQGSKEGREPADEVGPFVGRTRWEELDPAMLDQWYAALERDASS